MPGREAVGEAMRATPRADYLPGPARHRAAVDAPVDLGHGSTCSQPSTVRTMLELLDVHEGQRVLDVGSGSGWTTAILARLVGPAGRVVGVEVVDELVQDAAHRLRRDGLAHASVRVAAADELGAPDAAPFDRILVSAMAGELPDALLGQLAPEGLMVLPLRGRLARVTLTAGHAQVDRAPGGYRFVPLQTSGPSGHRRGRRWPWGREASD
ncbi:protein-L-isoaspartate O-methyltransferase family protein [Ornithinimicrobium pekingense]|uniref:Protein-L-isoaspartate O-methyltransferase n=1 Tax=Ornithinimicrobium pekingense TaxID=384677 RepID=A0ABQ2F316_9MICO|nr:methyltransferase domain-containing protein [Ornithinimicrobium pekingense]GGK57138.1 fibrillarin-like rRNA methylase [Ornithinimicrobium pekingense]